MRYLYILLFILTSTYCEADIWTQKSDFPNGPRSSPYAFSIGGIAYVGGGFDQDSAYHDLWAYDPSDDSWTKKAYFPGVGSSCCFSFTANNKGYVCTGGGISAYSRDLWEYDPSTDIWAQKPYFPGIARIFAAGFVIGDTAYAGTGINDTFRYNDFYKYSPIANSWHAIAPIPDSGEGGTGFALLGKGYVVGMEFPQPDGSYFSTKLWQYDPSTNSWTAKAPFPGTPRCVGAAFVLNGKAYYGTGSAQINDLWEYDAVTDAWTQKAEIPGGSASAGVSQTGYFSILDKGYICFGGPNNYISELWEYTPSNIGVANVQSSAMKCIIAPDPFVNTTTISTSKSMDDAEITLTDVYGRVVSRTEHVYGHEHLLTRGDLSAGLYVCEIRQQGQILSKSKVVVQ